MAYTEEQYRRAKAQLPKLAPEDQARIGAKIAEYESANLRPGESRGVEGEHPAVVLKPEPAKLSHESDPSLAPAIARRAADPWAQREAAPDVVDETKDDALPTASKIKALARKPEVTAPLGAGLQTLAIATLKDPLDGPLATSYYEPSAEQFMREQAPLLQAKRIQPGTPGFQEYFDEYKDRKWVQAHDAAEAEGRPLTRMEYINHDGNRSAWEKLGDILSDSADTASTFAKSFAAGRTLQATKLLAPVQDKLGGTNVEESDQAQAERNPTASFAGDLYGSIKGPLGEITRGATPFSTSAKMGMRIGSAAIGGAVGGLGDAAARAAVTGASDELHGGDLSRASDQLNGHLAGSALLGAGFGAGGQLVAEGANAYQRGFAGDTPEIGQLRRGGGDTDILTGIRPGKGVAENVEAAREPLPGEDKARFGGTPTEYAINKVREPLAKAHTDMNAAMFERLGGEKNAYIEAHPETQSPVPVRATSQKVVDWVRSKLQPGEAAGYLPGMQLKTQQVAPGGDVTEAAKLAQQVFKPRLVTATEAKVAAQNSGGFVVDVDQAKKLGFHVGGLDSEGVPSGAPAIETAPTNDAAPEASAGSTAEDVFGRKAEKPSASPVDRLKPRPGRAFKTPVGEPGSDWFDKQKAAETVALHSGDYEVNDPFAAQRSKAPASPTADTPTTPGGAPSVATPSVRPTTPPVELRAKPSPAATQAQAAGLPTSHFKVVLEPQEYNASKFEDILGDIDRKAGYAKASGNPDPKWDEIAQAIREDRKQFGPGWTDLVGKHHVELNKLEQRSVHAGFAEDKAHPEMGANAQIRLQNKLRGFPDRENVDSQDALREIAAAAPPGVQKDLEVLGATNAFQSLKGSAKLRTTGTLGMGGMTERLAGMGGFLKPRADALARDLSAGPTGEPTITPRLHAYLNQVSPSGAKWLPGAPRMGGGALGLKAAVAYDALTPAQQKLLQGLLEKLPGLKKSEGVTP